MEGGYVSIVPATLTIPGLAVILEGEYVEKEVEEKAYLPLTCPHQCIHIQS